MPNYAKIKYFVSPKTNQFITQLGYKYKETISQRIQHRLNTDINIKTRTVKDAQLTIYDVPENVDPPNLILQMQYCCLSQIQQSTTLVGSYTITIHDGELLYQFQLAHYNKFYNESCALAIDDQHNENATCKHTHTSRTFRCYVLGRQKHYQKQQAGQPCCFRHQNLRNLSTASQ